MKIAVVHSEYSSQSPSGENVVVAEQAAALQRRGHEIAEIRRRTDDEERKPLYSWSVAGRLLTGMSFEPRRELDRFEPDIIHLHNTFPNFGTSWLASWGQRTVATLHNFRTVCAAATLHRDGSECTDCLSRPVIPALRHGCYRSSRARTFPVAFATAPAVGSLRRVAIRSAALVVLSTEARAVMKPFASGPVHVCPNFAPTLSPMEPARRWVYSGRLSSEKGILELIEQWPAGAFLDIYGDGPLRDTVLERIRGRAEIEWKGLVSRETWLRVLPQYLGLLVPSLWSEGIPTVILEALSAGVPVGVSSQVGVGQELASAGAGVRFDVGRGGTEALRRALTVLDQPSTRKAAEELHRRRYSETAWLTAMEAIYDDVLQGVRNE